jgi:hypothetical protein
MGWNVGGFHSSEISISPSLINQGIAVQDLPPESSTGDPQTVIDPWNRGEVTNHQENFL